VLAFVDVEEVAPGKTADYGNKVILHHNWSDKFNTVKLAVVISNALVNNRYIYK
jgi:hypothetical protein